jgi:hypothetical protein
MRTPASVALAASCWRRHIAVAAVARRSSVYRHPIFGHLRGRRRADWAGDRRRQRPAEFGTDPGGRFRPTSGRDSWPPPRRRLVGLRGLLASLIRSKPGSIGPPEGLRSRRERSPVRRNPLNAAWTPPPGGPLALSGASPATPNAPKPSASAAVPGGPGQSRPPRRPRPARPPRARAATGPRAASRPDGRSGDAAAP